jgi:hypothetical protein
MFRKGIPFGDTGIGSGFSIAAILYRLRRTLLVYVKACCILFALPAWTNRSGPMRPEVAKHSF